MAAPLTATTRPANAPVSTSDRRLTVEEVLRDLVQEGLVTQQDADTLLAARHLRKGQIHPLQIIADQKLKDPRHARRLLNL